MIMFSLVWFLALIALFVVYLQKLRIKKGTQGIDGSKVAPLDRITPSVDGHIYASKNTINYLRALFPDLFDHTKAAHRALREVQSKHKLFALFFKSSIEKKYTTVLHVFTLQTLSMFLVALFYDFSTSPDNNEQCQEYKTLDDCLKISSEIDATQKMCEWNNEKRECSTNPSQISNLALIIIFIAVAIVTFLLMIPIDTIIDSLLNPTKNISKTQSSDDVNFDECEPKVNNINFDIEIRPSMMTNKREESKSHVDFPISIKSMIEKSRNSSVVRVMPAEVSSSRRTLLSIHKLQVAPFENPSIKVDPLISSVSIMSFLDDLKRQIDIISSMEDKETLTKMWGVDINGNFKETRATWKISNVFFSANVLTKFDLQDVLKDIEKRSEELKHNLSDGNDEHRAIEILNQFISDLLGPGNAQRILKFRTEESDAKARR